MKKIKLSLIIVLVLTILAGGFLSRSAQAHTGYHNCTEKKIRQLTY